MPGLNHKQKKFALEYRVDSNGTQAVIRAGYSHRGASDTASRLLANPAIRALIDAAQEKVLEKLEVKGDKVLTEIAHFAHSDPLNVVDDEGRLRALKDIPEHTRRAIKSIEIEEIWGPVDDGDGGSHRAQIGELKKVTFWDKPKGLELLGKNQKLWTDKVEHTVSDSLADLLAAARKPGDDE